MAPDWCADLRKPSIVNFTLSIVILLGILLSYLPQHYRIVARRSSEGLSPYFILLGTTASTCSFANILTLPVSRHSLGCCRNITGFQCSAAMLAVAQMAVQWSCFTIILLLFLLFFPHATPTTSLTRSSRQPSFRLAITIFVLCILHAAATFLISLVIMYSYHDHLQTWATILGIMATVLAVIQFLPQILTTWRLQEVGSLSIPMMCIQTPGGFVWAGSLALRFGWAGWSTWGIFLVTGALQGCLLIMSISFELRDRKLRNEQNEIAQRIDGNDTDRIDETSALLNNER